jgi:hypothetical protein
MTISVTFNTVTLAMDHHGISKDTEDILNDFNLAFTIIFMVEMGFKLIGLGIQSKFRQIYYFRISKRQNELFRWSRCHAQYS